MNNRRKLLFALGACVLAAPPASLAQTGKTHRIGYLGPTSAAGAETRIAALRAGLRELGYVEGKNLAIDFRWADDNYDQLPQLAIELVQLKPDVIVTHGTPGSRAAMKATSTIPIVMATAGDALLTGLVSNLARPEGNITGSIFFNPELAAKRLEVLRDTFPRLKRVAVLENPGNPAMKPVLAAMEESAKQLKLELLHVGVRGPKDFDAAFATMAKSRAEAMVAIEDAMLNGNLRRIAELALQKHIPAIGLPEFADEGALLAYGVNLVHMFRRAAIFIDKIFKGTSIKQIPVERATTFETVLNMKTARTLGIKFPDSIKIRADRIIE
jgi:putative ABC transport system substrate-binding protein